MRTAIKKPSEFEIEVNHLLDHACILFYGDKNIQNRIDWVNKSGFTKEVKNEVINKINSKK